MSMTAEEVLQAIERDLRNACEAESDDIEAIKGIYAELLGIHKDNVEVARSTGCEGVDVVCYLGEMATCRLEIEV